MVPPRRRWRSRAPCAGAPDRARHRRDGRESRVFAVARAAAHADTPMAAALGIANHVGPRAHAEWRRNHVAASKAACAVVWAWLGAVV